MTQQTLMPNGNPWHIVGRFDPRARELADRHYSRQTVGDRQFIGPGECMVLLTLDGKALFVWLRARFRRDELKGVECTIFRNEGPQLSSYLIEQAEILASARWPGEPKFTYVAPDKIQSTWPGYCFKKAGWHKVEGYESKVNKLHLLVKGAT